MNTIKKGIPSFFTSLGLLSGCVSVILSISYKDLTLAGYFILIAAVFDFVDGFAARLVNYVSEFGKQLDSLADVVSFGVAPSMILYRLIELSLVKTAPEADFDYMNPSTLHSVLLFSAFLVTVFSALRLARFNLDPGQTKSFKGLAVPANAILISGLGFAAESGMNVVLNPYLLAGVIVISCYLLVSNIRMFSFKFSDYSLRNNLIKYIFLLLSVILLIVLGWPGLTAVIVLYILLSVTDNALNK